MSLKAEKINDKIIKLSANTAEELGQYFLRFQEHYESPEWRGKIFTIGQFRTWYSQKYGVNSYEKDWAGYNIPSYILKPFLSGLFDPLSEQEKELLNLFRYRTDDFYIIGSNDGDDDTLDHEICHALWYTVPKYRSAAQKVLIENQKQLRPVYDYISGMMYDYSVYDDEVHAYMSADLDSLKDEGIEAPENVHKQLRALKKKYFK